MNAALMKPAAARRLPHGVRDRLSLFAEWTGAPLFPADQVVEECDGGDTFTASFLRYCSDNGASLDWLWLGDERGLVIQAHHALKEGRA